MIGRLLRRAAIVLTVCVLASAPFTIAAQTPCAIETRTEKIGAGTIAYNVVGTGSAIVLLHGLFANKEQWTPLACRLADAGYRVFAVDLPGYGKSDGFAVSDYRLERQVDTLRTLVTTLRLERVHIAGNSIGGTIAALYASRFARGIRSVAFIGSPLGIVGWSQDVKNAIFRGINPFIPIDERQLDLELQLLFATPPQISQTDKKQLVDAYVANNRHYVQVWNIVALYDDILVRTSPAGVPTLIIWGDDDRIFSPRGALTLHRRIPWSELYELPHAGHLLHVENVADVARIYGAFLGTAEIVPNDATAAQGRSPNPASQNCIDKGGAVRIETQARGAQFGVCIFDDNRQCEEWAMMRGDCPVGGIKVAGFVTPAARYCAITGGDYKVTANSNTPDEQGTCTFNNGATCNAVAYFEGTCTRGT